MTYTTPRLDWVDNEIVLPSDLNRLEENARSACMPSYAFQQWNGLVYTIGITRSAFWHPGSVAIGHTSYTGRVKIQMAACIENNATSRTVYMSAARNGVNVARNKPLGLAAYTFSMGIAELTTIYVTRIIGDATIGESTTYYPLFKTSAGDSILHHLLILIEDA